MERKVGIKHSSYLFDFRENNQTTFSEDFLLHCLADEDNLNVLPVVLYNRRQKIKDVLSFNENFIVYSEQTLNIPSLDTFVIKADEKFLGYRKFDFKMKSDFDDHYNNNVSFAEKLNIVVKRRDWHYNEYHQIQYYSPLYEIADIDINEHTPAFFGDESLNRDFFISYEYYLDKNHYLYILCNRLDHKKIIGYALLKKEKYYENTYKLITINIFDNYQQLGYGIDLFYAILNNSSELIKNIKIDLDFNKRQELRYTLNNIYFNLLCNNLEKKYNNKDNIPYNAYYYNDYDTKSFKQALNDPNFDFSKYILQIRLRKNNKKYIYPNIANTHSDIITAITFDRWVRGEDEYETSQEEILRMLQSTLLEEDIKKLLESYTLQEHRYNWTYILDWYFGNLYFTQYGFIGEF